MTERRFHRKCRVVGRGTQAADPPGAGTTTGTTTCSARTSLSSSSPRGRWAPSSLVSSDSLDSAADDDYLLGSGGEEVSEGELLERGLEKRGISSAAARLH